MAVVPGRFDHHSAKMGIAGLGDPPRARLVPLECSEGTSQT